MTKVFIDGSAGTTGLRIHSRLMSRDNIELISLPEALRKDAAARREAIGAADIVFLCLPDAAAREAVALAEGSGAVIIDTSTAHRVAPGWTYGFPELRGRREAIAASKRIANPGCHATGFISIVAPLRETGMLPADAQLSCFSLTGYTGGGKNMIADYEGGDKTAAMASPGIYSVGQVHKHLPEMMALCSLDCAPLFFPVVDDYPCGMATTVGFHASQLKGINGPEELLELYREYYKDEALITVEAGGSTVYGCAMAGRDSLRVIVNGSGERMSVTAVFDNLGKGASGAAIQNMNIVLGLPESTGLEI